MRIQIINGANQILTIGQYTEYAWALTKATGFSEITNELGLEDNAFVDGSQIATRRIPAREVDLEFVRNNPDPDGIAKRNMISFLNVEDEFIIKMTEGNVTRWIKGDIHAYKVEKINGTSKLRTSVTFLCADPFFNSEDSFGKNLAEIQKVSGFPWWNPIGEKSPIGLYNFARMVSISNDGDMPTYPVFKIVASGEVTNPKVMVNDVYLRVIDQLETGDVLDIDLTDKTVRKNGENCLRLVDRTSSFYEMRLNRGINYVQYSADYGDVNMSVSLYYYQRFMGA